MMRTEYEVNTFITEVDMQQYMKNTDKFYITLYQSTPYLLRREVQTPTRDSLQ